MTDFLEKLKALYPEDNMRYFESDEAQLRHAFFADLEELGLKEAQARDAKRREEVGR